MANTERRRFLKGLLGALAGAAGTVVLAATDAKAAEPPAGAPPTDQGGDIQERADRLADAAGADEQEVPVSAFVNRAFRNGGFGNGYGGGFRNGGFRNGYGGGFRNGAFRNW